VIIFNVCIISSYTIQGRQTVTYLITVLSWCEIDSLGRMKEWERFFHYNNDLAYRRAKMSLVTTAQ